MAKARSLRACLPQLKLMLRGDSSCQQALVSDWESDEECLCAVLRLAIECRVLVIPKPAWCCSGCASGRRASSGAG